MMTSELQFKGNNTSLRQWLQEETFKPQKELFGSGVCRRFFHNRIGAVDVLRRGIAVGPAPCAIERMRIGTEAKIRLAPPILQVVQRLVAGQREV